MDYNKEQCSLLENIVGLYIQKGRKNEKIDMEKNKEKQVFISDDADTCCVLRIISLYAAVWSTDFL